MALSGNLQDVALPDILQLLAAQGKGGVLTLTRGQESVRILIAEGMAVHADSNQRSLHRRLGRMLVGADKLTTADLRRALVLQRASGRRLGEVLVAEGMVSRADVRRALNLQFRQILYGVLRWEDGSYDFERRAASADRDDVEPVSFQSILMDGMRMIDEWPLLEKRFTNRQAILHRTPRDPSGPISDSAPVLEGLEAEVFERIDGRSTIQQIVDRSMQLEFDVCRALYDLMERGLIGPAYEGELSEVDFPDLLLAMRCARGTGVLELRLGEAVKTVTFRDGELWAASSSDPDDGIGPFLVRRGVICRRDLEQSQAVAAAAAHDLGEELGRSGAFAWERLESLRLEHEAELVLSLFSSTGGSYRFRPGAVAAGPAPGRLLGRTTAIVLRGIQAVDRWSRIARAVGSLDGHLELSVESAVPGAWAALPEEHRRILDLIAGGLTVVETGVRAEVPELFLHQLIWAAKVLGILEGPIPPIALRLLVAALTGAPSAGSGSDAAAGAAGECDAIFAEQDAEEREREAARERERGRERERVRERELAAVQGRTTETQPRPEPREESAGDTAAFDIRSLARTLAGLSSSAGFDYRPAEEPLPPPSAAASATPSADFDPMDLLPDPSCP